MMVSGEPFLDVTPLRDLTQPGSVKSQMNVCVAYWPPPSSSFTLIMIIPSLVMMENLSCFWALHLHALSL